MARGTSRLTSNRDTAKAWRRKSEKPLPAYSTKRSTAITARRILVADILRDDPFCVARIAGICTGRATEVNELKRRSAWAEGYLIRWNCEGLCHECHEHITHHPGRGGWAMRHGHQVSRQAPTDVPLSDEYIIAIAARHQGQGCPPDCPIDHRREPTDDE